MNDIEALNRRFAIKDQLLFSRAGDGLIVAEINNRDATASVCLQGGHVMSWRPKTEAQPVVWVSPLAKLAPGKSIRGGVPVCWPWFGPHASGPGFPAHGFARTVPWAVSETRVTGDGATVIALALTESEQARAMWNERTTLTIVVTAGRTLKVELTTANLGERDVVIGEALHTYFQVGDIADTRVLGLEGATYFDKVEGMARNRQDGPMTFAGETDRVYVDTVSACTIDDRRLARRIVIAKSGSRSTVVWNPWAQKAEKMGDFGPEGWRAMLCVESANALDNVITVKPGERHTLMAEYRVERG
jgi:D-hexose-6-phosphate mutarotase